MSGGAPRGGGVHGTPSPRKFVQPVASVSGESDIHVVRGHVVAEDGQSQCHLEHKAPPLHGNWCRQRCAPPGFALRPAVSPPDLGVFLNHDFDEMPTKAATHIFRS